MLRFIESLDPGRERDAFEKAADKLNKEGH